MTVSLSSAEGSWLDFYKLKNLSEDVGFGSKDASSSAASEETGDSRAGRAEKGKRIYITASALDRLKAFLTL